MLKISNLTVNYGPKRALDNVTLEIPFGGYTLGIVGESGSGKTTMGNAMMRLVKSPGKIVSGKIEFEGQNVLVMSSKELRNYRWKQISMVFQSAMNALNPVKPILDHVIEVLREHSDIRREEARTLAEDLLLKVGIPSNRARSFPHEFSGGMRQRTVIAMALALSPKVLIADEPTSALDIVVQDQILSLIQQQVTQQNLSLIFITHEISLLPGLVDNVAVMYEGEVVELGQLTKVLYNPIHPYTEMLLSSLLTLDSTREALFQTGNGQDTASLTSLRGCKYATRCKYRFERCFRERPVLREVEKGRWVSCHKY